MSDPTETSADNAPPAADAHDEAHEAVVVQRARARTPQATLGMVVVGAVAAVMLVMLGYSMVQSRRAQDKGRTSIAAMHQDGRVLATDPNVAVSPAYQELVAAENREQIATASRIPNAVVVPPIVGSGNSLADESFAVTPTPDANTVSSPYDTIEANQAMAEVQEKRQQVSEQQFDAKVQALTAIQAVWGNLSAHEVIDGVTPADDVTTAGGQLPPPPAPVVLPVAVVLPALVEVGANSDYPGQIVVRLSGDLRDVRLVGDVQSANGNGPNDRLVLRFGSMVYRNSIYPLDGFAVDPNTRIAAVKGKINRHIFFNVITQSAVAFLAGYSQGVGQTRISNTTDGVFFGGQTASQLVRSSGAQLLSDELSQIPYRRSTVTLTAGSLVGVVITTPPTGSTIGGAPAPITGLTPPDAGLIVDVNSLPVSVGQTTTE